MNLSDRVAALEARDITLADLPLGPLQRKLEGSWQPEGSTFLLPGSVTRASLAQKLDYGTVTVDWPGGAPAATPLAVTHDLGVVPTGVVAWAGAGQWTAGRAVSLTATGFTLEVRTFDGTSPAAATTQTYYWLAFA